MIRLLITWILMINDIRITLQHLKTVADKNGTKTDQTQLKPVNLNQVQLVIACPSGHVQREASKGVRAVCPECHEQLKPLEEIQINRAIA